MTQRTDTGKQHIKQQTANHGRHAHQGSIGNQQHITSGKFTGAQKNADGQTDQKGNHRTLQTHFRGNA